MVSFKSSYFYEDKLIFDVCNDSESNARDYLTPFLSLSFLLLAASSIISLI